MKTTALIGSESKHMNTINTLEPHVGFSYAHWDINK